MTETGLIVAEVAFLVLLYLFVWAVVRSSTKALRTAELEIEPPAERDDTARRRALRRAGGSAPAAPTQAVAPQRRATPVPVAAAVAAPSASSAATRVGGALGGGVVAPAAPGPRLVVTSSPALEPGTVIPVEGGVTIGRSKASQFPLGDQFVSHTHARVVPRGPDLVLEDLGSLNGTFVNGKRVRKEETLRPRDEVRLGETVLRLEP